MFKEFLETASLGQLNVKASILERGYGKYYTRNVILVFRLIFITKAMIGL
jgi:hypothetical protein